MSTNIEHLDSVAVGDLVVMTFDPLTKDRGIFPVKHVTLLPDIGYSGGILYTINGFFNS